MLSYKKPVRRGAFPALSALLSERRNCMREALFVRQPAGFLNDLPQRTKNRPAVQNGRPVEGGCDCMPDVMRRFSWFVVPRRGGMGADNRKIIAVHRIGGHDSLISF